MTSPIFFSIKTSYSFDKFSLRKGGDVNEYV